MSQDEVAECPLCMEPLDPDDLSFYPCTCGYQICRFCWHRLRTGENGLCPACRKPYSEDPADFRPLSLDEMQQQKAKNERRAKKQRLVENRRHLANVRVVQRNLVFVVGLPPRLACADQLRRHECFGRFGRIHKVVVNQATSYAGVQGPSASAYVTYVRAEDALRAIQAVNNVRVDGKLLKASLGTTKYCNQFLKGGHCPKPDCMYLHELGDEAASFTKEQMHAGKHTEYERRLHEQLTSISHNSATNNNNNSHHNNNGSGGCGSSNSNGGVNQTQLHHRGSEGSSGSSSNASKDHSHNRQFNQTPANSQQQAVHRTQQRQPHQPSQQQNQQRTISSGSERTTVSVTSSTGKQTDRASPLNATSATASSSHCRIHQQQPLGLRGKGSQRCRHRSECSSEEASSCEEQQSCGGGSSRSSGGSRHFSNQSLQSKSPTTPLSERSTASPSDHGGTGESRNGCRDRRATGTHSEETAEEYEEDEEAYEDDLYNETGDHPDHSELARQNSNDIHNDDDERGVEDHSESNLTNDNRLRTDTCVHDRSKGNENDRIPNNSGGGCLSNATTPGQPPQELLQQRLQYVPDLHQQSQLSSQRHSNDSLPDARGLQTQSSSKNSTFHQQLSNSCCFQQQNDNYMQIHQAQHESEHNGIPKQQEVHNIYPHSSQFSQPQHSSQVQAVGHRELLQHHKLLTNPISNGGDLTASVTPEHNTNVLNGIGGTIHQIHQSLSELSIASASSTVPVPGTLSHHRPVLSSQQHSQGFGVQHVQRGTAGDQITLVGASVGQPQQLNSLGLNDMELGFDPIYVSQKGLADLIEREECHQPIQFGHNHVPHPPQQPLRSQPLDASTSTTPQTINSGSAPNALPPLMAFGRIPQPSQPAPGLTAAPSISPGPHHLPAHPHVHHHLPENHVPTGTFSSQGGNLTSVVNHSGIATSSRAQLAAHQLPALSTSLHNGSTGQPAPQPGHQPPPPGLRRAPPPGFGPPLSIPPQPLQQPQPVSSFNSFGSTNSPGPTHMTHSASHHPVSNAPPGGILSSNGAGYFPGAAGDLGISFGSFGHRGLPFTHSGTATPPAPGLQRSHCTADDLLNAKEQQEQLRQLLPSVNITFGPPPHTTSSSSANSGTISSNGGSHVGQLPPPGLVLAGAQPRSHQPPPSLAVLHGLQHSSSVLSTGTSLANTSASNSDPHGRHSNSWPEAPFQDPAILSSSRHVVTHQRHHQHHPVAPAQSTANSGSIAGDQRPFF